MMNTWLLQTYGELTKHEEGLIEDLIWDAEGKLDYETRTAVEKLRDFKEGFDVGNLELDTIVELINTHTDDHGVEYIINEIKDWRYLEQDEVTLEDYTTQMLEWAGWTNKQLAAECDYQGLATSGTKSELIERLVNEYLSKNTVKTI